MNIPGNSCAKKGRLRSEAVRYRTEMRILRAQLFRATFPGQPYISNKIKMRLENLLKKSSDCIGTLQGEQKLLVKKLSDETRQNRILKEKLEKMTC